MASLSHGGHDASTDAPPASRGRGTKKPTVKVGRIQPDVKRILREAPERSVRRGGAVGRRMTLEARSCGAPNPRGMKLTAVPSGDPWP